MNDQAGRAQDSADAGMEKTAKSTMQRPWSRSNQSSCCCVQKLDISVSINDQQALQDMDSMMNRIQQAASQAVKIAVELVGPDGKYRTDARSALDWLTAPCRKSSPMPKAVPFLAPVPARTAFSAG
jgi:hypothetical protein